MWPTTSSWSKSMHFSQTLNEKCVKASNQNSRWCLSGVSEECDLPAHVQRVQNRVLWYGSSTTRAVLGWCTGEKSRTFAPGIARLFFRVREISILPPRFPTCTGSNGAAEYTGSVNWGWGSHIILGFQLGDSFGSVSCKTRRRLVFCMWFIHWIIRKRDFVCPTIGVGEDLQPARDNSENSSQNTVMPSSCRFLWANVVGWCTLTSELSSSVSSQ